VKFRKLAALVVLSLSSVAVAATRNPAQEAAIDQELSAIDPTLVAKMHEANTAIDNGDARTAASAYAAVHARAPEIVAVTRRLCTAEARAGMGAVAVEHCREATRKQDSAENHSALAMAVLALPNGSPMDLLEARDAAIRAHTLAPNTESTQATLCEVALHTDDITTLDNCSASLRKIAPTSPETHVYTAFAYAERKDIDGAESELRAARDAGLDAAAYAVMHGKLEAMRPKRTTWEKVLATALDVLPWLVGGWIAISFVLLVLGMLLSDAATKKPSRTTRSVYRVVVMKSVAMFYVSAVLGALLLIAGLVFVTLVFLAMVHASHVVEAAFGAVALYVAVAAVRALFGRVEAEEPGMRVDLDDNEDLRETLDAITKRAKMKKIDEVYVVPDATLEVREIGSALAHVRDRSKRVLVLGVAALDGLDVNGLAALVTSELLRFRARDGAGGDLAIVERDAIESLAERFEERGVASSFNPAWWFVSLYRSFFERVTEGAVEYQEELADARAARAYGSETLAKALRHLAGRSVEIEARAAASIHDVLDGEGVPDDVYARDPESDLRTTIDEAHEELAEREKRIAALEEEGYEEGGEEAAWSLFADRKALTAAMNERLRAAMREHIGLEAQPESSESTVARA
jgi:hypothetical protein